MAGLGLASPPFLIEWSLLRTAFSVEIPYRPGQPTLATSDCPLSFSAGWLECFHHAVLGYAVPAVCNCLEHAQRSWIATLAGGGLVRPTRRRVPAAV